MWTDPDRSQTHESGNWDWGRAIPRKGIHKWDFRCTVGCAFMRQQRFSFGASPLSSPSTMSWVCCMSCIGRDFSSVSLFGERHSLYLPFPLTFTDRGCSVAPHFKEFSSVVLILSAITATHPAIVTWVYSKPQEENFISVFPCWVSPSLQPSVGCYAGPKAKRFSW